MLSVMSAAVTLPQFELALVMTSISMRVSDNGLEPAPSAVATVTPHPTVTADTAMY